MHRVAIGSSTAQTGFELPVAHCPKWARRGLNRGRGNADRMTHVLLRLTLLLILAGSFLPLQADARSRIDASNAAFSVDATPYEVVQRDGMSLNQAIESVRRRGDVERVLGAETRVEGGREVHHIKVMTKNGTVKTVRVNGRRR